MELEAAVRFSRQATETDTDSGSMDCIITILLALEQYIAAWSLDTVGFRSKEPITTGRRYWLFTTRM